MATLYICMHRSQEWSPQVCHLSSNIIIDIMCCFCDSVLHQCWNKCVCIGQSLCRYVLCGPNGNASIKIKILVLLYFYFQIFGGFLVNLGSIGSWLNWLQYLSIFRYALNVSKMKSLCDWLNCLRRLISILMHTQVCVRFIRI